MEERTKIQVLAPVVRARKGEHVKEFEAAQPQPDLSACGWTELFMICPKQIKLEKNKKHTIEIVVDRLVIQEDMQLSSGGLHWKLHRDFTGGLIVINVIDGEDMMFSQNYACPEHGISIEELDAAHVFFQQSVWCLPKNAQASACL